MIAVIDYGAGNLQSVVKALNHIGCECIVTDKKDEILKADGAILPGVGSFADAMDCMRKSGADKAVLEFVQTGKAFLGICLGLQLLFDGSEESPGVLPSVVYLSVSPFEGELIVAYTSPSSSIF